MIMTTAPITIHITCCGDVHVGTIAIRSGAQWTPTWPPSSCGNGGPTRRSESDGIGKTAGGNRTRPRLGAPVYFRRDRPELP
jgi:hypothetical protein